MYRRTVFRIEPDGPGGLLRRIKVEEIPVDSFDQIWGVNFSLPLEQLPPWGPAADPKPYGTMLYKALAALEGIGKALGLISQPPDGELRPIYFYLDTPDAELYCWEALCDANGFLALQSKWPIGRIANSVVSTGDRAHAFAPPLKLMAVISALGDSPETRDTAEQWDRAEWETLYKVVKEQRQEKFPIKMRVVVGQEELLETIKAIGGPDLEVFAVPETPARFKKLVEEFGPHIIHFFCHGKNDGGKPRLQVARITDWDQDDPALWRSSLELGIGEFRTIKGINDIWLVTLNCCEGSKASKTEPSLTHALVSKGVPAAVGMLESVEPKDAHEFCEFFYGAVLGGLRDTYERVQINSSEPVDWAVMLSEARDALNQPERRAKNDQPAWTLPVVYVRRNVFQVQKLIAAPTERHASQAVALNGLLDLLGPLSADSPEAARLRELLRAKLPPDAPAPAVPAGA